MNRNITEPWSPSLPAEPAGRVLPPLHPRRVRAIPPPDITLPGDPVRVVRQRRRPVRSGAAGVCAAGLDERRNRCRGAAADPVGDLARVPVELDGGPRLGCPEPPGGTGHAARDASRRRVLRRLRLRAGPDRTRRGGARGDREPDRLLSALSGTVPARPVRPARKPVRGQSGPGCLDGRLGRSPSCRGRDLPDPRSARPGSRTTAAQRPRPGRHVRRERVAGIGATASPRRTQGTVRAPS